MRIIIRLYNGKNKVIKRLIGKQCDWRKLYSKLASAAARKYFVRVEYDEDSFNEYEGSEATEARQALRAFLEK